MTQATAGALAAAVATIQQATSILAVSHVSPDGDAIGSLLAFGEIVQRLGKPCTLVCADPPPASLHFLPGIETIQRQAAGWFDLAVGLDASDPRRLGESFTGPPLAARTLNIDHHVTNTRFANVNWVEPAAAATAELVFILADALHVALTPTLAANLLAGVVTDTRGFRTSNTTPRTLQMASQLMAAGAPLFEIMDRALERRTLKQVHLWGMALQRAQLDGRILWSEVTSADRQRLGLVEDDADAGLSSFLINAEEADVSAVFVERGGKIEVSLRAIPGLSVAEAATALGGGGHPPAAGCTLAGPLDEIKRLVLATLTNSLAQQTAASSDPDPDAA